jgi:hypothetical protein
MTPLAPRRSDKNIGTLFQSNHPITIKNKKPQTSWGFFIFVAGEALISTLIIALRFRNAFRLKIGQLD